ncbi:hypothetical protein J7896_20105, partial [Vibrio parahaemolyticus]|nr:hypothetical protein [Vibrio parahaemolyticus]MCF9263234.1 hypothetical protein [Vibrio parahaemolyticus]
SGTGSGTSSGSANGGGGDSNVTEILASLGDMIKVDASMSYSNTKIGATTTETYDEDGNLKSRTVKEGDEKTTFTFTFGNGAEARAPWMEAPSSSMSRGIAMFKMLNTEVNPWADSNSYLGNEDLALVSLSNSGYAFSGLQNRTNTMVTKSNNQNALFFELTQKGDISTLTLGELSQNTSVKLIDLMSDRYVGSSFSFSPLLAFHDKEALAGMLQNRNDLSRVQKGNLILNLLENNLFTFSNSQNLRDTTLKDFLNDPTINKSLKDTKLLEFVDYDLLRKDTFERGRGLVLGERNLGSGSDSVDNTKKSDIEVANDEDSSICKFVEGHFTCNFNSDSNDVLGDIEVTNQEKAAACKLVRGRVQCN